MPYLKLKTTCFPSPEAETSYGRSELPYRERRLGADTSSSWHPSIHWSHVEQSWKGVEISHYFASTELKKYAAFCMWSN